MTYCAILFPMCLKACSPKIFFLIQRSNVSVDASGEPDMLKVNNCEGMTVMTEGINNISAIIFFLYYLYCDMGI